MFCVLQRILQCGLSLALGLLGKETLTDVDNGPTMRDLLKEMEKLRSGKILFLCSSSLVIAKDGCIEMPKTSSMKSLQERERSRVLEVVLHETVELSVQKVVDWHCE